MNIYTVLDVAEASSDIDTANNIQQFINSHDLIWSSVNESDFVLELVNYGFHTQWNPSIPSAPSENHMDYLAERLLESCSTRWVKNTILVWKNYGNDWDGDRDDWNDWNYYFHIVRYCLIRVCLKGNPKHNLIEFLLNLYTEHVGWYNQDDYIKPSLSREWNLKKILFDIGYSKKTCTCATIFGQSCDACQIITK